MKTVSVLEMQEMDRRAIEEIGIPSIVLMENAGRYVAEAAISMLGNAKGKKVTVFCGTGNNGGDGFVAARYLAEQGAEVSVNIIGDRSRIKNEPKINLGRLEKTGVDVREILRSPRPPRRTGFAQDGPFIQRKNSQRGHLVIDAIFGIGLKGEVKEPVRSIIMDLNKQNIPILSVDVPSGLDADSGEVLGGAIRAKKTVTMQFPKNGFYINKGPECVGEVVVADIGIPEGLCAGS